MIFIPGTRTATSNDFFAGLGQVSQDFCVTYKDLTWPFGFPLVLSSVMFLLTRCQVEEQCVR